MHIYIYIYIVSQAMPEPQCDTVKSAEPGLSP